MNKRELITILEKSNTLEGLPVRVRIQYPDTTFEYVDIESFSMCSDAIALNVRSTVGFDPVPHEPRDLNKCDTSITCFERTNDGDTKSKPIEDIQTPNHKPSNTIEWIADSWDAPEHTRHIQVGDCIEYEATHYVDTDMGQGVETYRGMLMAKSFDYDADCAVRAYAEIKLPKVYDSFNLQYVTDTAPGLIKYRFLKPDDLSLFISHMPTYIWDGLPINIKERYKEYRY